MTKPELIDELAKAAGLTKQESAVILETVFECITAALVQGTKVELRGFGSFTVRQHRSRTARNPKVGTAVYVPAKKVPHFKTSKQLRNLLNATAPPVSVPSRSAVMMGGLPASGKTTTAEVFMPMPGGGS